jgi:hypothetical protein
MRPYLLGSTNNIQNCKTNNRISTRNLKKNLTKKTKIEKDWRIRGKAGRENFYEKAFTF